MKIIILIITSALLFPGLLIPNRALAATDSVSIVEISPDPSQPLKVGQEVTFKAKVNYVLNDPSGTISLVVQRGEHSGGLDASLGSAMEVITKGEGQVTLEKTVKVPDTKAIQIFTPLSKQSGGSTSTVEARFYKVEK